MKPAFSWDTWLIVGFAAQALFGARFLVQWISSERRKESHIPLAFWYFSLLGGGLLLAYAVHKRDPVFITGQATGLVVYIRNLHLIRKKRLGGTPRTSDSVGDGSEKRDPAP